MFKGKKGQALASDIGKRSKTFVPGEKIPEKKTGPSKEDIELIKVSQISMHVLFVSMSKKNSYRWQYWIDHLQSYNKHLIWQRKDKRWSSKITSRNSCLDFQIFYSVLIFFWHTSMLIDIFAQIQIYYTFCGFAVGVIYPTVIL